MIAKYEMRIKNTQNGLIAMRPIPALLVIGTLMLALGSAAWGAEPAAEATTSRPAWVEMSPRRVGDTYQMAVTVGPYATRLECDARLPEVLQSALDQYVETYLGTEAVDRVDLPSDYLRETLLSEQCEEPVDTSFGRMTQVHALLEFGPEIKQRIDEAWRRVIIARRLLFVAAGTSVVLAVLGMVFVYLKLTASRADS